MDKQTINNLVAEKVVGLVRQISHGVEGWATRDGERWFSSFNPYGNLLDAWFVVDQHPYGVDVKKPI